MKIKSIVIGNMSFDQVVSQIEFSCIYQDDSPREVLGSPGLFITKPLEIYRRRGRVLFDHKERKFLSHTKDTQLLEIISKELGLC
jgi:hypothetical protein